MLCTAGGTLPRTCYALLQQVTQRCTCRTPGHLIRESDGGAKSEPSPTIQSQKADKLSASRMLTTEKSGSIEQSGRVGLKGRSLDQFSRTQRPATCLPPRCMRLHGKESRKQGVECHASSSSCIDLVLARAECRRYSASFSSPTDMVLLR